MEKGKDLIFTALVQVKPEVELGKYEGIEIKKVEYPVTDEDVKKEIEKVAEKNSRLVSVEDRGVQNGDITVIDFKGTVDGVAFDGGTAEGYELEIGSHSFIEGFEDQMVGMKVDEERDINVTFPEEYFSKELAGKPAVFKVLVHEIKVKELPAIDDELAKDASEFETLKEWEASIKEDLEHQNGHKAEGMNIEKYLELVHQSMDDLRNSMKENAEQTVRTQLVLEAVANDLGDKIKLDEEKIKETVKNMAAQYGKTEEELNKNEEYMEYVHKNQMIEKTVEYLMEKAKIK